MSTCDDDHQQEAKEDLEQILLDTKKASMKSKLPKRKVKIPTNLTREDLVDIIQEYVVTQRKLQLENKHLGDKNKALKQKLRQHQQRERDHLREQRTRHNQSLPSPRASLRPIADRVASGEMAKFSCSSNQVLATSRSGGQANTLSAVGASTRDECDNGNVDFVVDSILDAPPQESRNRAVVVLNALSKYRNLLVATREIQQYALGIGEEVLNRLCSDTFNVVLAEKRELFLYDSTKESLSKYDGPHSSSTNSANSSFKRFNDQELSHCMRIGRATVSENDNSVSRTKAGGKPFDPARRSVLCCPIFLDHDQKNLFGVFRLMSSKPGAFGTDDKSVIESLLNAVGSYFHRANLSAKLVSSQFKHHALLEVVNTVSNEYETSKIIEKIIKVAYKVLNADRVSMFLVDHERQELVSMVSQDTQGFRIPMGKGIAGSVAITTEDVLVDDAYKDPTFDRKFDLKTNYRTKAVLCTAVLDSEGKCLGVLQAINKKSRNGRFTADDKLVMRFIADNAGITLHKAQLIDDAYRERKKNAALVEVVKAVNSSEGDPDKLVENLVNVAYCMVDCQRVTLFLVDDVRNELVCKVSKDAGGFRIPIGKGIAGYVAETGETVNIPDAYKDDRFNQAMDKKTGFVTRNILCMAIRDHDGRVVAVVQAINKVKGIPFDTQDEYLLEAFSAEVAVVLKRAALETVFKDVVDLDGSVFFSQFMKQPAQKSSVADERHLEEIQISSDTPSTGKLLSWGFNVLLFDESELLQFAVDMLRNCNLLERFDVSTHCLRNFLLGVRSGYRPNPFHNFHHAIMVMQISFLLLHTTGTRAMLDQTEVFALLIAALCHDLDHPGRSNGYEINSKSDLALFYNDIAVLENHHASSAFAIMSKDKSNILKAIQGEDYKIVRKCIVQAILATDMTHHFDMTKDVQRRTERTGVEAFAIERQEERQVVMNVIIHCADLANPVLPDFKLVKVWALMICKEFSNQAKLEEEKGLPVSFAGELETELGVAKLQLGFLDYVVGPLWKAVGTIFPDLAGRYEDMKVNREKWRILLEGGTVEEESDEA